MTWSTLRSKQPRVADILSGTLRNDRLAHAYLFSGPKGTLKKEIATHLAKSLFCLEATHDACGQCMNCLRIDSGNHPNVYAIAPDGQSIKIDQVRELRNEMKKRSVEQTEHKVYILEHVDKMTVQAANSLLKFLEEPPRGVVAILTTENIHAILPTILSRCITIPFAPLPAEEVALELQAEGVPAGIANVACQITTHLDGARQLSQSEWFAQLRTMVIQLGKEIKQRGTQALFTIQDQFQKNDKYKEELPLFLDLLILWLRDILYVQTGRQSRLVNIDQQDVLEGQALIWTQADILRGIQAAMETRNRIERNVNPQLALERLVLLLQEG
ncbi:DNA polymerase III subunit delta' [Brevibacillus dissolubilis]|uniref:DNA polymerase III subunit delta' n=1 Tax=Brevibacillus dissolubilis TaxID=1844116 RepID=UPI001115F6AC|nr:DNA polymerase III subunit delta' [Brevibacillus dissolubilis]